jgi:23S rRNA (adenine2030-N6)-methyltransferase
MNYRHAFHAGNAADCFKHAVLVWLLRAMARKDTPFFVLDTHAGTGRYDLAGAAARRSGEAARGILRLTDDPPAPLADYVGLVRRLGLYPGSPALVAALLRPGDRAVACELHPEDHAVLRRTVGRLPGMAVHLRDGWEALGAFLPPPERRGLTLIDPPYEAADEYDRVVGALRTAQARFAQGVVMAWYPVKHRAPVRALHDALRGSGLRDIVAAELLLRAPLDAARLNGSGLIIVNPPFRFEAEIPPILAALLERLGDREAGEGVCLLRIADE